MKILNILVIDDDPTQIELFKGLFEKIDYPPCKVSYTVNSDQFFSTLSNSHIDLVITDYFMPDITGRGILERVKKEKPECEVIVITSGTTTGEAINLMKKGAYDFIIKPISFEVLENRIVKIFELKNLIQENENLLYQLSSKSPKFSSNIVFKSQKMKDVINIAARAAGTNTNILIRGESGTGKELFARGIHFSSPRKDKPFITVNIAALPETIIESELFGHIKGAYTGADQDRKGRFEEAHEGTVFIDEAGDIPITIQTKLLRILQFGEFQRIGSNNTKKTDVRIIAATNRNLEKMIKEGSFREDLFYRLNVIPLEIPPLRERREDFPLLITHFLQIIGEKHKINNAVLTEDAHSLLVDYSYPGNIRELENIIEYAIALSRNGTITSRELPGILHQSLKIVPDTLFSEESSYLEKMTHFESMIILNALDESKGNQSSAARSLGISERKLRSRMAIIGIENRFR